MPNIEGVLVPVVTALIASGGFWGFIKGLKAMPFAKSHRMKVWEDIKSDALEEVKTQAAENNTRQEARICEAERRAKIAEDKAKFNEFRTDLTSELMGLVFDDLERLGAPHETMQKRREVFRKIRFAHDFAELNSISITE